MNREHSKWLVKEYALKGLESDREEIVEMELTSMDQEHIQYHKCLWNQKYELVAYQVRKWRLAMPIKLQKYPVEELSEQVREQLKVARSKRLRFKSRRKDWRLTRNDQ